MMFPETNASIAKNETIASTGTKTYLSDFDKGDFVIRDGKLVECNGIEAVKIWIEKAIRTEKSRYSIYEGTAYGCHLEDLIIGNNYTVEFVEAELKREIEEMLLRNPQISNIDGFKLIRDANSITVTLEVYIGESGANSITLTVTD